MKEQSGEPEGEQAMPHCPSTILRDHVFSEHRGLKGAVLRKDLQLNKRLKFLY